MNSRYKQRWKETDTLKLAVMVIDAVINNRTKVSAFKKASLTLGRTPRACEYQWYNGVNNDIYKRAQKIVQSLSGIESLAELKGINSDRTQVVNYFQNDLNGPAFSRDVVIKYNENNKYTTMEKINKTKLEQILEAKELMDQENLKVFKWGQNGKDFIVTDADETIGYVVVTDGNIVKGCQCKDRIFGRVICKHMVKVALENKLEI